MTMTQPISAAKLAASEVTARGDYHWTIEATSQRPMKCTHDSSAGTGRNSAGSQSSVPALFLCVDTHGRGAQIVYDDPAKDANGQKSMSAVSVQKSQNAPSASYGEYDVRSSSHSRVNMCEHA